MENLTPLNFKSNAEKRAIENRQTEEKRRREICKNVCDKIFDQMVEDAAKHLGSSETWESLGRLSYGIKKEYEHLVEEIAQMIRCRGFDVKIISDMRNNPPIDISIGGW
jgi:hypothetical protein